MPQHRVLARLQDTHPALFGRFRGSNRVFFTFWGYLTGLPDGACFRPPPVPLHRRRPWLPRAHRDHRRANLSPRPPSRPIIVAPVAESTAIPDRRPRPAPTKPRPRPRSRPPPDLDLGPGSAGRASCPSSCVRVTFELDYKWCPQCYFPTRSSKKRSTVSTATGYGSARLSKIKINSAVFVISRLSLVRKS